MDPLGMSLSSRHTRKLRGCRTRCEEATYRELKGRVGMLRMRKEGCVGMAHFVVYLPSSRDVRGGQVCVQGLGWIREQMGKLPARCIPIVCMDANICLGSLQTADD